MYNILRSEELNRLKTEQPERFKQEIKGGEYLKLQNLDLESIDGIDISKLEKVAFLMRGFMFSALEASHSGHPGGSSGKTEQFLAMVLGGAMAFDPLNPKNNGRDRVVWSAGHCTPCLYGGLTLFYESLKKAGRNFSPEKLKAVMAKDLLRFRHNDGPQGHVESYNPLADVSTGPSGHGLSAGGGIAIAHKSCGLPTKVWVLMGDAETEEGMSYEARNIINSTGTDNLIVSLDYNHYGIDGDINEVIDSNYLNHWLGMGWNLIEVNGHNFTELIYAYHKASQGFGNGHPTVVLCHTLKGKFYGDKENTATSHGTPAKHDEYVAIMKNLGFEIQGIEGDVSKDLEVILNKLDNELANYITERLDIAAKNIKSENELIEKMKTVLVGRPFLNPLDIVRPENLPKELIFTENTNVATRKATQAWFEWLMKQTAFFYAGTGDLSKSILTDKAEAVYGLINKNNPFGRGIRFGIAEQNMAMMSIGLTMDRLPGNFAPISVFSSYAVFTSMMSNCVRLALIGNHLNPDAKGFFIMLAAHDGPETGEDGPTHQGLFWMSMFNAYPGIKVYKPMDANETIEMLFYALEIGEPIALSVSRPDTIVFDRKKYGNSIAKDATYGAYIFKDYNNNGKKKIVLAVCGGIVLANTLEVLEELENQGLDIKIIAVTSPQLFEELRKNNPEKAKMIFSDEERAYTVTLHDGWKGFLYPFILPADYEKKTISIDEYLKSGTVKEVYELAKLTAKDIRERVMRSV